MKKLQKLRHEGNFECLIASVFCNATFPVICCLVLSKRFADS